MLRILTLAAVVATLTACQPQTDCPPCLQAEATAPAITTNDRTYVPDERIGQITKGMTEADIKKLYGEDQLVATTLYGPEGITYEGYHLFPGTDDQLDLSIADGELSAITRDAGSRWVSAEKGIRIGTSLAELNRLNGRPFALSGFGWDYGGFVNDWKGGALEGHRLRLGADYELLDPDDSVYEKISGDINLMSDDPNLQEAGVRVFQMYFGITPEE